MVITFVDNTKQRVEYNMKKYEKLFFDFDDTLIDFKAAEKVALPAVFKEYQMDYTEKVDAYYKTLNRQLWSELERGEITRDQLMKRRFGETMLHFGRNIDGYKMDERYQKLLAKTIILIDGAEQVLKELSKKYELYIVTNGMQKTQRNRFEASGLTPYIKRIFVSEEIGYQKPQIEFFNYVFSNLKNVDKSTSLIIGDSFSADIIGGYNAGIDTCWFNPHNQIVETSIQPTYVIKKLYDLVEIL